MPSGPPGFTMASRVRVDSLPVKGLSRVGGWLDEGRPLVTMPLASAGVVLSILFAGPVLAAALAHAAPSVACSQLRWLPEPTAGGEA
jgi:hypothetical protein